MSAPIVFKNHWMLAHTQKKRTKTKGFAESLSKAIHMNTVKNFKFTNFTSDNHKLSGYRMRQGEGNVKEKTG